MNRNCLYAENGAFHKAVMKGIVLIMIIHSIVPMDFLMEQPKLPEYTIKQFKGGMVEGVKTEQGFVINRLISTDPSVYLNPKYSPGQIFTE